jgi:hypothetical protein
VIQQVFLIVNSFLQLDFIIAMIHILICQICGLGSMVRAVALYEREIAGSDSNGVLLL